MARTPKLSPVPSYRLYRERTHESREFWIHCETIPARTHLHNWEIAVHRHDAFFQIFLVTAGSGEMLGGGAPRQFEAPCALFIPPGAAHGFRFARDVDGLVVTALADRLTTLAAGDRAVAEFAAEARIVGIGDGAPVANAIHRIHAEAGSRAAGSALLMEALVTDTVVSLARTAGGDGREAREPGDRDARRIEALEDLIGAHYREQRPVAFYASRLGLSAPHLNRLTRQMTGFSVQELVSRRVLDSARRELVFTPTPVQAIALALGFQDPAYFNRFFRKRTGTTPGAYREAERRRLAR